MRMALSACERGAGRKGSDTVQANDGRRLERVEKESKQASARAQRRAARERATVNEKLRQSRRRQRGTQRVRDRIAKSAAAA